MAAVTPAGIVPAGRPTLPPDVAQMLAEADRWNAYADRMNRKALAAGVVTAETLDAARWASERAIRAILDNYNLDNDPDLRAWHEHLDQLERQAAAS